MTGPATAPQGGPAIASAAGPAAGSAAGRVAAAAAGPATGTATVARLRAALPGGGSEDSDLPEEAAVAIVVNGTTQAVMMASPADLEDFATGFALTEGLCAAGEAGEVEVVEHGLGDRGPGIEARLWLPEARAQALAERRRAMLGPVGCGLCGIDSLEGALRALPPLPPSDLRMAPGDVAQALDALRGWQPLHDATRATHAAGFWRPGEGIVMAREDVGRHNALDKLAGGLARAGVDAATGAVVLTSRVSVEMVQKTVAMGAPVLLAVSAPTALAVRIAEGAGLTVASRARGHTRLYSRPDRIGEPDVL